MKILIYFIKSKEHIRICSSAKDKSLTEFRFDDVKTLYDVLSKGQSISCKNSNFKLN